MKNVKCGVYKITNTTNKKFYIGSSKDIDRRWKEHIWQLNKDLHSNFLLQEEWNEYGENSFKFEVLELCKEEERFDLEQKYLNKYEPFVRLNKGYNIQENVNEVSSGNNDNITIFIHRYHCRNPFYNLKKSEVKALLKLIHKMSKANELDETMYERFFAFTRMDISEYKNIDTKHHIMWYTLRGENAVVRFQGKEYWTTVDFILEHTKREIEDWCIEQLMSYTLLKDHDFDIDLDEDDMYYLSYNYQLSEMLEEVKKGKK